MNKLLEINPKKEKDKIIEFLNKTFKKQQFEKVVIGLSGGIDSTTCLYLLKEAVNPKDIIPVYMPYFDSSFKDIETIINNAHLPKSNLRNVSIKKLVDDYKNLLSAKSDNVRIGNIMARVRMILLFDLAKKHNAFVCGTENKSEYYLGYFTRFGDEASDLEPLRHLYKTQIYALASYLKVLPNVLIKPPTAGLWEGQTDEREFGFSYQEADVVLYLYFEKNQTVKHIQRQGHKNADKVIQWALKNSYKHHTPYSID